MTIKAICKLSFAVIWFTTATYVMWPLFMGIK